MPETTETTEIVEPTLLTNDNYISGDIFKNGLSNTLLKRDDVSDPKKTYLIIFNEESGTIIAGTKQLSDTKGLSFNSTDNILTINKIIEPNETKNYITDENSYIANGFALIRTEFSDTTFPIFGDAKPFDILIKGALGNNPIFSKTTKFVFNEAKILFGLSNFIEE